MGEQMTQGQLQDYIIEYTDYATLYEQLAEEAIELAHAALKKVRILRGGSPTPIFERIADDALIEEFTDVRLCADLIDLGIDNTVYERKLNRWVRRLVEKETEHAE